MSGELFASVSEWTNNSFTFTPVLSLVEIKWCKRFKSRHTWTCWICLYLPQTCASGWGSEHGLCTSPAASGSWGPEWVPCCSEVGLAVLNCPSWEELRRSNWRAFWRSPSLGSRTPLLHETHHIKACHTSTLSCRVTEQQNLFYFFSYSHVDEVKFLHAGWSYSLFVQHFFLIQRMISFTSLRVNVNVLFTDWIDLYVDWHK